MFLANPKGLTNWNYHMGLAIFSGVDARYSLKLVCEDVYTCSEQEGYDRNRCDCRNGKKELPVSNSKLRGTLKAGEDLNEEIFFNVEGKGERYNKAVLKVEWTGSDGKPKSKEDENKKENV